jgi:creatinine amidohydrolase
MTRIPVPEDPKVVLSELLPHELAARVRERPIAVLPIGSIEYHGPQCAFHVDMAQSEIPCWEAVRRKGGVCVDSMCWGGRAGHRLFPGSILVRTSVVRDLLIDIIDSLRQAGFRAVLGVTGHAAGGHMDALREVQELYRNDPHIVVELTTLGHVIEKHQAAKKYRLDRGIYDHGGANETGNIMASAAHRADLSQLPPADAALPFVALEGLDPHLGTAEYGRRVLQAGADAIAAETDEVLAKALAKPLPLRRPASLKVVFRSERALGRYVRGSRKNFILPIQGGIRKTVPIEKGKTEYVVDDLWTGMWGVLVWGITDTPAGGTGVSSLYEEIELREGPNELRF